MEKCSETSLGPIVLLRSPYILVSIYLLGKWDVGKIVIKIKENL